jgi:hypothetical protein
MGDVDVLALDDWAASVAALEAAGFVEAERADHAWSFVDPLTRGLVELHRSVTSCPQVFAFEASGVWSRSRVAAAGQVGRVPATEDLLVQLAQHALFQHAGVLTLGQWLDFRRIVESPSLDTALVLEVARGARALACVQAAVLAARGVVGGPARAGLDDAVALPRLLRRWVDGVRRDPLSAVTPTPPPLVRLRWAVAAGRRWALVAGTLDPGAADRRDGDGVRPAAIARRAASLVRRWGTSVLR